jgi:hypothetical protein
MPSKTFYNGTKGKDIVGPDANEKCSIHYWAEHGIVGRGVLLDIWRYANAKGETFDPWEYHSFSYELLEACGRAQGIDIRPEAQGGDILPGDILMIRGGWTSAYRGRSDEERKAAGNRKHLLGHETGQRWAGVGQNEKNVSWLHDCYFSCVGGDMPSFEAWPTYEGTFFFYTQRLSRKD